MIAPVPGHCLPITSHCGFDGMTLILIIWVLLGRLNRLMASRACVPFMYCSADSL